jgi:uncharacterized protein (TIGR04551 family)
MRAFLLSLLAIVLTAPPARAEFRTLSGVHASGYFRTRFLGFGNLDLDNGGYSGAFGPLLDQKANQGLGSASDFSSSMASRLRLDLNFDLSDGFAAVATFDLLDNHLFGATAQYPYGPYGYSFGGDGVADPARPWLRVKQVYGVVRPFSNFEVRAGRQAWSWGLGMLHNDGRGLDADYGSYTDGLSFFVRFLEYEVGFSWDFAFEGPVSGNRYNLQGQPHSMENLDDVGQWRFHVLSRTDKVEWGLLNLFRTQSLSSEEARWQSFGEAYCKLSGSDTLGLNPQCYTLVPRGYKVWEPSAYVIWHATPWFTLEAEAAMQYGSIRHLTDSAVNDVSADVMSGGALVKASFDRYPWHLAGELAMASGDSGYPRAFGQGYAPEAGQGPEAYWRWNENPNQYGFFFARDRHLDLLLFREIIGTFTNALAASLPMSYDLFKMDDHLLTAGFKPILSYTFNDLEPLGLEADAWLEYNLGQSLRVRLDGAYLQPFSALDNPYRHLDASGAWTVQAKLWWVF